LIELLAILQGYKGSMLKVGGKNGKSATVSFYFYYYFTLKLAEFIVLRRSRKKPLF